VKPDFPYYDAMDLIQQHLVPRTYVEIGVSTGRTFQLALPGTRCVGIDPAPRLARPVTRGQQIFTLSSDEFFATHDLRAVLGGDPLDLAFIDGMHHFEFALRDFINLERAAHPESTILIHDCLPENEEGAARDRTTVLWSGDVWRLIVLLRRWRPDLEVSVADWPPTGLGVVRHLDPGSTVLADHYHELVEHYLSVPYSALDDGTMDDQLNRVPGTCCATSFRRVRTVRAVSSGSRPDGPPTRWFRRPDEPSPTAGRHVVGPPVRRSRCRTGTDGPPGTRQSERPSEEPRARERSRSGTMG